MAVEVAGISLSGSLHSTSGSPHCRLATFGGVIMMPPFCFEPLAYWENRVIVETLLASAARSGDRPAVADPTGLVNYGALTLFAQGMKLRIEQATKCERVGILLPTTTSFAGVFYGVLWAGRTAVPLNYLLQPGELKAVVEDAQIDTVFASRHFQPLAEALPVKAYYLEDLPIKAEIAAQASTSTPALPSVAPDDVAVLLYTSGTAGVPKGVCLTHRNLCSDMEGSIARAMFKGEHRFLGVIPLFHTFGLTAMLLIPISLGASIYYLPRFSPKAVFTAVRENRSSVLLLIASMYTAMLRSRDGTAEDLASLVYPVSGGEALAPAVFDGFKERFGIEILQGYGMTEASPVVSLNTPWSHKPGTVGQAIDGVSVASFADDGGAEAWPPKAATMPPQAVGNPPRPLPVGQTGELWIKGPIVMKGYYRKEAETRAAITPEGWYKSGDMGFVDADGFITINGRKKEMIIVGGENVYPREVESALEQHAEVAEAAVIGEKDPTRGEVVVAFVILKEGAEATEMGLREFCREQVAGYKVPRRVFIAKELPRGPTGKILKRKLVEML